jgi:predicted ArsR family transcriptional regulator
MTGDPSSHGATETRMRVLDELRAADRGLHPHEIAVHLNIHVNTVHRHLDVLEGAGLVVRLPEDRTTPGRPRVLYEAVANCDSERVGHRFLARALAAYVVAKLDPNQVGEEAGEAWGRHLIDAGPFAEDDPEVAIQRAMDLLEDLGFQPTVQPQDQVLELGKCPFPQLAAEMPDLICTLHAGLIRGALSGLGAPLVVTDFEPKGPDAPCVLRYDRRG